MSKFNLKFQNNIPEELRKQPNWVCHRDKVPVSAVTGQNASCADPSTWCTFETAIAYADANDLGIGYQFSAADDIVGIDIDHCIIKECIDDNRIKNILKEANSYYEVSPSGTGVHIYVRGTWDSKRYGNKANLGDGMAIEVYNESRYFTVTGHKPEKVPSTINKAQGALDQIAKEFFTEKSASSANIGNSATVTCQDSPSLTQEQEDLIEAEVERSEIFANHWQGERPNGDESKDDFALICNLLKLFHNNVDVAKAAFLASPHTTTKDDKHRAKLFGREDYLQRTLEAAVTAVESGEELQEDYALLQFPDNDAGNADKFLHLFADRVRYCYRESQWYVYSQNHWHPDFDGEVQALTEELYERFQHITTRYDDERVKAAKRLGDEARRSTMLKAAANKCKVKSEDFDKHNHFISAANGIVDLQTSKLVEFNPAYLLRQRTDVAYNPDAPEPTRFLQFLNEIFCGDQRLIEYCLRLLGYLLTGESREQTFYIWHGEGANGKSVLVNLLHRLFKDITAFLAQDALLLKNSSSTNPSLFSARFSRICFVNETNRRDALNTALVKALSGGDVTAVRTLYKGHVDLEARFKIVFVTNHLPNLDWNDTAILRRVKIIPFKRIFTEEEQDNRLIDKLYEEREGILKVLVEQAVRYYNEGMPIEPDSMKAELNAVRLEDDSVYAFFNEKLERTFIDSDRLQARPLFDSYREFCSSEAISQVSEVVFAKKMAAFGIASLKTNGCKNYTGVKFSAVEQEDDDTVA